jgi:putative ABC transport system permease protein
MLLADIRYALRGLWLSRGFAAVAILCLGFGIGANTTIFSIADGVLLKPYPYPEPDRLMVLGARQPRTDNQAGLSYPDLRDWKAATTSFTTIAGEQNLNVTVADGSGEPERYQGAAVSWDLFPLLGMSPVLGLGFRAEDDQPGAAAVVLLSYDLWTRRYMSAESVIGRTILVNTKPSVIVGVMPPGFAFPNNQKLWVPLGPLAFQAPRDPRPLLALGRLKPGVTSARAIQELEGIAGRLAQLYPGTNEGWTVRPRTLRQAFLPDNVSLVIGLMMAGATLVLLIACSNVANLLLARAASRRREISVRAALGAGRGRIVRQLLTESVVLGLVSVPLGILLAEAGTRLIAAAMPPEQVPAFIRWSVDWRSMAYSTLVGAGTALVFGLFPALQVSRGQLHESLKEGTRGNSVSRSRLRGALVIVQVSLAVVSLVGALLFVRTFLNLDASGLGFDPTPLMTMRYYLPGEPYDSPDAKARRVEDVIRRVEALPGVAAAFSSSLVPLAGGGGGGPVEIAGRPNPPGEQMGIFLVGTTPHFFKTLGVTRLRGRDFTDAEGFSGAPVAIVNETMAKRFWPDADPIGQRASPSLDGPRVWFTVIGVVPDLTLTGVGFGNDQPRPTMVVPYQYQRARSNGLTVRVAGGDPAAITLAVRAELRASDPNLPLFQARTMDEVRRLNFWEFGLYGWIFGTIGVVGLLLAAVGVYGVLSYSVSQRTQEIGVRVALGASRRDVLRLVVASGLRLSGVGVGVGLALAPVATWLARSLLYRVSPFDPVTFGLVAAFLMLVAFVASYVPARRATRVDPVVALRGE